MGGRPDLYRFDRLSAAPWPLYLLRLRCATLREKERERGIYLTEIEGHKIHGESDLALEASSGFLD